MRRALSVLAALLIGGTILAGEPALDGYALTMPNLQKMVQAYEAIDAAAQSDTALAARLSENDDETAGIDALIAKHEADPAIKKAFAAAGISVRDGVLTLGALAVAAGAVYVQEQTGKEPEGSPTALANVKFYEAHRAEIETLNGRLRKLGSLNPDQDEAD
jgi:hypothetical protein